MLRFIMLFTTYLKWLLKSGDQFLSADSRPHLFLTVVLPWYRLTMAVQLERKFQKLNPNCKKYGII